jgi:hypothetical protein
MLQRERALKAMGIFLGAKIVFSVSDSDVREQK